MNNQFVVKFANLSSAQSNKLAEELCRALGTIPKGLQVERFKEDPNTLDEGGALLILVAVTAIAIYKPDALPLLFLAEKLVEFSCKYSVNLQIENKLGEVFHIMKDLSHAALDETKKRLQEFLQKDRDK